MKNKGLIVSLSLSMVAVALAAAYPREAIGDQGHSTYPQSQHAGELVRVVRDATRRFRDVRQAEAEGYHLLFGCVSGPDDGAMGLHYVNMDLVADGVLDPRRPEIVIYEPTPNGGRRLIGADFLVFVDAWHASNPGRRSSADSSCTCSRRRIVSACRPSIRCTSGPGSRIAREHS